MRKKAAPAKTPVQATKPSTPPSKAIPPRPAVSVTSEGIRLRAYQKWEAAGRPEGDGVTFWLEAERELLQA